MKLVFELPEIRMINNFLDRTLTGIDVTGNTRVYLEDRIVRLTSMEGFRRFLQFMEILDTLATSEDLVVISDFGIELVGKDNDADRLNRIFHFVFSHLQEEIRLEQVAEVAHLSPNGFCRFFKRKTRKSFFRFLIEARISKSRELLRESEMTIAQCAYESGFNNLSHFNREFVVAMGMTPRQYRVQFNAGRYLGKLY